MSEEKGEREIRKNGDLLSPYRKEDTTPVVDFVNRETEAHEDAQLVVRLWCFFFWREGRRMRKKMGKAKQDIQE